MLCDAFTHVSNSSTHHTYVSINGRYCTSKGSRKTNAITALPEILELEADKSSRMFYEDENTSFDQLELAGTVQSILKTSHFEQIEYGPLAEGGLHRTSKFKVKFVREH